MIVHCSEGLGNRVAAMANGLSRTDRIEFVWIQNEHVPARWHDLFPRGIHGVTFSTGAVPWPATAWDSLTCERWDAAGDRARANAAYGRIMHAMAGTGLPGCTVALAARFHRNPEADARRLAMMAAFHAPLRMPVFVFADSRRAEIRRVLDALDVGCLLPAAPALATDLDRTRGGLIAYCQDWKRLLAARRIVAIDGPSSALHPARAAGIEIIYVSASFSQDGCGDRAAHGP